MLIGRCPWGGRTCAAGFLLAVAALTAAAETGSEKISLDAGNSLVIDYTASIGRIAVSNPEVLDAVAVTDREILLNGKLSGNSSLVVWSRAGQRKLFEVSVDQNLDSARQLLKDTFPNEWIDLRGAHDSLSLVGHVSTQILADRALELMKPLAKTVVNNLQIALPGPEKQIVLRVKFAELDRNVGSSFGVNLISTGAGNTPGLIGTGQFSSATPGSLNGTIPGKIAGTSTNFTLADALNIFAFRPDLNLAATIKALQDEGVLQILAEPNLVTTDGKEASFLVGGEIPVPVVQGGVNAGAVTIQFREFGIRLSFLPVFTPNNTIKLHIKPEVSTIDLANSVVLSGFRIPALATRRIETNIELGMGQSFVIAGLIDDRVTENLSKIPGLSRIPLLGAIFRSKDETKSKTELVVIVTPEVASPLPAGSAPPLPTMPRRFLETAEPEARKRLRQK